MTNTLDACWDYGDPAGSEVRLREWLAGRDEDGPDAAEARTQVARALVLQRRFADGHAELDRVEPLLPDLPDRVRARYHLERGRTWRDEGDDDGALAAFAQAWEAANAAADEGLAVDAAHMLALVTSLDEAERWVEHGVTRAEGAAERRVRGWAFTLSNNHAHRVMEAGDAEGALRWLDRAERAAADLARPELVRKVVCGRARAWRFLGRIDDAEGLARRTLEEAGDGERVVGFLHEEIGEALLARGDLDAARPHLRAAVEAFAADPWFGPTEAPRLARLKRLVETC